MREIQLLQDCFGEITVRQIVTQIKPETISMCMQHINMACDSEKPFEMVVRPSDETLAGKQIALANIWYGVVADSMGLSVAEVEARCKIKFGVPLLKSESISYSNFIDKYLGGMNQQERIAFVQQFDIPVIRKGYMSVETRGKYLGEMQRYFSEQSIFLTSPNEKEMMNCREANQ